MTDRVLPAIAFLAALGIFFWYVNPTWTGSVATTRAAIAADAQALASAERYLAQQNLLASKRDAIDPTDIALLTTFLPDSVDNVGLILDLNALAARSQLALSNVDVVSGEANGSGASAGAAGAQVGALPSGVVNPVGSVDVSLAAVGTFSALQEFLVGVEKSARLLDVRDLTVKGSDTGVYNYQMTLRIYWLR
jgi:hypothetical protein